MPVSGVTSCAVPAKAAVQPMSKSRAKAQYYDKINEKYKSKNMRLKAGTYYPHRKFDVLMDDKPHVLIADDLLQQAAADPALAKQLEEKIGQVTDAYKWLGTHLKESDRKLTECVFSMDKKGVITCSGKVKKGEDISEFSLPLCKVTQKYANLTSRLTMDFEFKGFRQLNILV